MIPTTIRALFLVCLVSPLLAQTSGRFEYLADYSGVGGVYAETVGPGADPVQDRLYATFMYPNETFDLVQIDPGTGACKTYPNPVPGEYGCRCIALGPDQNLYLGTLPGAHLLKFDPRREKLEDLGRPASTETYIWCLVTGADGKIYGGTFPNAHLVRYDPATARMEDLGRADPIETYLRYLAASPDGYIYGGIGSERMGLMAYQIATGHMTEVLPGNLRKHGFCQVFPGVGSRVYANVGGRIFGLQEGGLVEVDPQDRPAQSPPTLMRDGRSVVLTGNLLKVTDSRRPGLQSLTLALQYQGRSLTLFRMGIGPDHRLYLNSVLPSRLLRYLPGAKSIEDLGALGEGEVYSFLSYGNMLIMGGYSTIAPVMAFDPSHPFDPQKGNPEMIRLPGLDPSWRPIAVTSGPPGDDRVYFGAVAGYGQPGGLLVAFNPKTGQGTIYPSPVADESIASLVVYRGMLLGGSNIAGGEGSRTLPNMTARLFLWDPRTHQLVWQSPVVAGASSINNLVVGPGDRIYGLAVNTFFVFDIKRKVLIYQKDLPFPGGTIYDSLALGPAGRLWGLSSVAGVFTINPATLAVTVIGSPTKLVTAGAALDGRVLYLICGTSLYRYVIP